MPTTKETKQDFQDILNNNNSKKSPKTNEKTANRTRSSATSANNQIQEKITNARNAVRKNTKAQIILGGISDALHDIAIGNFDDLELDAISALDEFTASIEDAHHSLVQLEASTIPLSLPFQLTESDDVN